MSTSTTFAECNIEHATWRPLVCDCSRTLDVSCIKLCRNTSQQLDVGEAWYLLANRLHFHPEATHM